MAKNTLLNLGYNIHAYIMVLQQFFHLVLRSSAQCCSLPLSQPVVLFHEGTHTARASLFIVAGKSRAGLIGQGPQLSHPSVSPHFRHTENTISSTMALISFEFVELVMHLGTTQDAAFPTSPALAQTFWSVYRMFLTFLQRSTACKCH